MDSTDSARSVRYYFQLSNYFLYILPALHDTTNKISRKNQKLCVQLSAFIVCNNTKNKQSTLFSLQHYFSLLVFFYCFFFLVCACVFFSLVNFAYL